MMYFVYLFVNGAVIVQAEYLSVNLLLYIVLILFFLYKFVFFGVYPILVVMHKPTIFVAGVALLFVGHYILVNDPNTHVYVGDLVKLLWVILIIISPTNLLHPEKTLKEKRNKEVEIIEV